MHRMLTSIVALFVLGLGFAANASGTDGVPEAAAQDAESRVRVAHVSPDAPNVDVWVDGAVVLSDVPYRAISDYLTLPAGEHMIQVSPTGATEPIVIDATVTLEADMDYTVAAVGLLADIEPLVLVDNNGAPDAGMAHVRFVHASPDAPAVDIAVAGGPVLFANVAFKGVGDYAPVAAGTYDLEARPAGTEIVALPIPGVMLDEGTVYTVFAVGQLSDLSIGTVVAVDSTHEMIEPEPAAEARVRVAHASPDAPNVDVWLDGAVVLSDVPFEAVSDYLTVPAGEHMIQVSPTGATEPIVIEATVTLMADMDYTVAAVGLLADIEPLVLVDDNTLPPRARSRVRFVHAAPDAPAVDIAMADGGRVLFSNVAFKEASDYLTIGNYLYDLEVRIAGTETVVLSLPGVLLAGQHVYTIFAMGLAGGEPALRAVTTVDAMAEMEPPAEGTARVRVAHAAPGAPNVDVLIDGTVAIANTAFGEVTDYAELDAGTYTVQIVPTGMMGPAVIEIKLPLEAGKDYTAAAVGLGGAAGIIEPLLLEDDNTPPAAGKAHVRFVHASPDAPAVDIAVADGGPVLFGDVAYKGVGDYLPVDAGTYDLEVRVAGTETVALEVPGLSLRDGNVYTVFALGLAGGEPMLMAVPVVDYAPARVRVAHASPDAPAVDVLVDGMVAFSNAPFGAVTDYAGLPAGTYNVQVVPTGMTEPVVIDADLTIEAGMDYTVAAVGLLADIEPLVMVDNNGSPEAGMAHVRFVHASPDAPAVDIAVAGGPVLFADVAFKGIGDYLPVTAGTYDLEVRVAGTDTVALPLPGVMLGGGTVYTVFAMGQLSDASLGPVVTADAVYPDLGTGDDMMTIYLPALMRNR